MAGETVGFGPTWARGYNAAGQWNAYSTRRGLDQPARLSSTSTLARTTKSAQCGSTSMGGLEAEEIGGRGIEGNKLD